jgi:hypothetical protein
MRAKSVGGTSALVGQQAGKVLVSPLLVSPSQTRSPTFIERQWMGAELGLPFKAASSAHQQTPNVSPVLHPQHGGRGSGEGGIQTGSPDKKHVKKQRLPSSSSPVRAHGSTDAAALAAHGPAAAGVKIRQEQMIHSLGLCVVWLGLFHFYSRPLLLLQ